MKTLLSVLLLFVCLPTFAQRFVEEIATVPLMKSRLVGSINKTVFVRGYTTPDDGGGGTFIITNSIIGVDTVFRIISSNNGAWSYDRKFSGPADMRWGGAAGNGTTDDSVPFQTVINASATKRYAIYVSGRFRITQTINLPSNTTLVGDGSTSEVILENLDLGLQWSGNTNISISGIKFSGSYARAVEGLLSKTITVENCEFTGATRQPATGYLAPLRVDSSSSVKLLNNWFHHNGNSTTNFDNSTDLLIGGGSSETHDVEISGNRIESMLTRISISAFSMAGGKIINNYVNQGNSIGTNSNNGYGILVYGTPGITYRNLVSGNFVTNTAGTGIYLRYADGTVVSGNAVVDTGKQQSDVSLPVGAIVVNLSSGAQVVNNGITNAIKSGINTTDSTNIVVSGNIIETTPNRPAIEIRGMLDNAILSGNIISTALRGIASTIGAGIWRNVTANGNSISNITDGIYIETGTNNIISLNQLHNVSNIGIYNAAGSNSIIAFNMMSNPANVGTGIKNDGTYATLNLNTISGFLTRYSNTDTNTAILTGPTGPRGFNIDGNTRITGTPNGTQYALEIVFDRWNTNQFFLQIGSQGASNNAFALTTDSSSNYVHAFNGVPYKLPTVQGAAGSFWINDGIGNISWGLPGSIYNFGDQFDVSFNTNLNLSIGLITTNQAFAGNVTVIPNHIGSVSGVFDVNASASTEHNLLLSGNGTLNLTNYTDYHVVNVTITNAGNFALAFTFNGLTNDFYWKANGNGNPETNDWGTGIINEFTFWKTGGRILARKDGLSQLGGGGGSAGANPTASIGLAAINGVSSLFMRSDAAPPLAQSIIPTWTGLHTWLGDASGLVDLRSTTAAASLSNLRVPFRFLDTDAAYYEAAALNVVRGAAWDGTGASRDGTLGLDVMVNGTSTRLLQLYSSGVSGTPIAWFPTLSTDLIYGNLSVLATTATRGFLYLTTCAGTPTGVPGLAAAGAVPLVFDTTNNKLYAYDGGWIDVTGAGGITTPVSIANGGTGTNTMGTAIGNIPFVSSSTNRLTVDNGNFIYDASSRVLEVLHPTASAQPHYWAVDVDTGVGLQVWASRIVVGGNADFVLDMANSSRSILFTNNGVQALELTPEWSTVVGDGTTTTTRTNKMLYVPTFAGLPTGVPHIETGRTPIGYNTTASKLYAYNSGWKDVAGPGFVRFPISQATLPGTSPARLDYVSATGLKRLLFATNETAYFQFTMPQDYGSVPVLRIPYSCSGATAGTASFSVSVWAQSPSDAADADTASYDTANVGTDTVPGTLNFPDVVLVTLTTNDSMAAGDTVAIQITSTSNALLNDLRVRGDMVLEYAKQ